MINYYAKFIPELSTLLHPLHTLLRSNQPCKWSDTCQRAFQEVKTCLTRAPVLAHYDPTLPLVLVADASADGMEAVISHRWPNGTERPIAYASRTLNSSSFHQYLYGRRFTLITDHQPLTTILGPKWGVPSLAAATLGATSLGLYV